MADDTPDEFVVHAVDHMMANVLCDLPHVPAPQIGEIRRVTDELVVLLRKAIRCELDAQILEADGDASH